MADHVSIGTGVSPGTTIISTDEVNGAQVQRIKPAVGPDGTAVDVSAANPMPTTDAAVKGAVDAVATAVATLDAQMGSAPAQTADVQGVRDRLPATLDAAGGVKVTPTGTVAVSGPMTSAEFAKLPDATTPFSTANARIVSAALYNQPNNGMQAPRTAASLTDADAGTYMSGSATTRWNGTAWSRSRTSTVAAQALLASADRAAATANGTIGFPSLSTYDCTAVLMVLSVTGIGTGNLVLVAKAIGSNATLASITCPPATFASAAAGAPVDAGLLIGTGCTVGNATGAANPAGARFGYVGVPAPAPGVVTGYTQHTDTSTWTYSLSYHLIA
jgi:hypothetical protein